jgi:hypothetical protein
MSRTIFSLSACIVASVLLLSAPVAAGAQGRGKGQAKKADKTAAKHEKQERKAERADVALDRDRHVRVIHDYVRAGSLPPGLAKRRALPPGLAKQLRERGELPPGLEKHWVDVPRPLVTRLPAVPSYYNRYFAGDDLVVVDTRTNRIAYLIRDVLR